MEWGRRLPFERPPLVEQGDEFVAFRGVGGVVGEVRFLLRIGGEVEEAEVSEEVGAFTSGLGQPLVIAA